MVTSAYKRALRTACDDLLNACEAIKSALLIYSDIEPSAPGGSVLAASEDVLTALAEMLRVNDPLSPSEAIGKLNPELQTFVVQYSSEIKFGANDHTYQRIDDLETAVVACLKVLGPRDPDE